MLRFTPATRNAFNFSPLREQREVFFARTRSTPGHTPDPEENDEDLDTEVAAETGDPAVDTTTTRSKTKNALVPPDAEETLKELSEVEKKLTAAKATYESTKADIEWVDPNGTDSSKVRILKKELDLYRIAFQVDLDSIKETTNFIAVIQVWEKGDISPKDN